MKEFIKEDTLISVIIPCYNVGSSIEWTIESVRRQSYNNIEIICVDDASTDNTYKIIEDISKIDPRVQVYKNDTNINVSETRNKAMEVCLGELVCFLDGDDYYEMNFIKELYIDMKLNDSDISQSQIRYIFNDKNYLTGSPVGVVAGEQCQYRIDINDGLPYLNPQPWNKLYKKFLFDGLKFKDIYYEDAEILFHLIKKCKRFSVTDKTFIHYNKRLSTITGDKKRTIPVIKYFFNSIYKSSSPYFSEDYQLGLTIWGGANPRCSLANFGNFLNSLVRTKELYFQTELKDIKLALNHFLAQYRLIVPDVLMADFERMVYKFKCQMGFLKAGNSVVLDKAINLSFKIYYKLYPLLDNIINKQNNLWVFTSWGRYTQHTLDNPRAVFEEVKNDKSIKKVVIIHGKNPLPASIPEHNIYFKHLHSFSGLWSILTSSVIITGYSLHNIFGYRELSSKKRKIIQLWHGIPIKKVGLKVSNNLESHWKNEVERYSFTISNSHQDKITMEKSFFPTIVDKVKLTGLPRHDFLINEIPNDYKKHLDSLKNRIKGKKLVLFAPTWRYGNEEACMFSQEELRALDSVMEDNNAILGIRVHANMLKDSLSSYISDNVIYINDIPDVNVVMRATDILITDYSSLYLDFMMTNKPVLLYTPDIENYRNHRGFNYSFDEFSPHNFVVDDLSILIDKLNLVLSKSLTTDDCYKKTLNTFSDFSLDGQASKRVLKHICDKE